MKLVTLKISEEDFDYLVQKTKSKTYHEKAWIIFSNSEIIEVKTI